MDRSRRLALQRSPSSRRRPFSRADGHPLGAGGRRIVNYYANLRLISSFAGSGHRGDAGGSALGSLPRLPLFLLAECWCCARAARCCCPVAMRRRASSKVRRRSPTYAVLVVIFACNTLLSCRWGSRSAGSSPRSPTCAPTAGPRRQPRRHLLSAPSSSTGLAGPRCGSRRDRHRRPRRAAAIGSGTCSPVRRPSCCRYATERHATWSPYHFITIHDEDGEVVADDRGPTSPPPSIRPATCCASTRTFTSLHGTSRPHSLPDRQRRWKRAMALAQQYLLPYIAGRQPRRV